MLLFRLIAILFLLNSSHSCFSQEFKRITVSGQLKEASDKEYLANAYIRIPSLNIATVTNDSGFYSISFEIRDTVDILFSQTGYYTKKTRIFNSQILDVELMPDRQIMNEIVITGNDTLGVSRDVQMSKIFIPMEQARDVPSFFGEKDVIKVLQLMPGVQKGNEGSTSLYVRGGGPDQNLIMLEGMPFYNVSHLYGFLSLFNSDVLQNVELTKGAFPARYGGKLSSVIDMTMKQGNKKEFHGEGTIGLLSSKLMLEGPLWKDKCSFVIAARRSYLDIVARPFLPDTLNVVYYFYDINAKVHWDINQKNKLSLNFFNGKDKFRSNYKNEEFVNNTKLNWSNILGNLQWEYLISEKLSARLSIGASKYKLKAIQNITEDSLPSRSNYYTSVKDITFKYELEYKPAYRHFIRTGVQLIIHNFEPGVSITTDSFNVERQDKIKGIKPSEASLYIEDTYKINSRFTCNVGGRITRYNVRRQTYIKPEPRLALSYNLTKNMAVKASYAIMNQYALLLSQSIVGPPLDIWVPSTDLIKPQNSRQVALGIAKDFRNNFALTIETYYKKSSNLVDYREGVTYLNKKDIADDKGWESLVTQGRGWAYGGEFLLQKRKGKISGWIGYTLSWNWMQFDSLNLGRKYPAKYDRRHDASVVLIYKPKDRFLISASWVYSTGNAFTMPVSVASIPMVDPFYTNYQHSSTIYSTKNGLRMPSYHRLDLSAQFIKQLKKQRKRIWEVSIYNVYNKQNSYYYFMEINKEEFGSNWYPKYKLKKVVLLPIIPSISYKLSF